MATLAQNDRSTTYTLATSTAGPFLVGFRLLGDDDLRVRVNGDIRTDFTVSSSYSGGYDDNASITFDAALAVADVVLIEGLVVLDRQADLINGSPDLVSRLNAEQTRLVAAMQEAQRDAGKVDEALQAFSGAESAADEAAASAAAAAASAAAAAAFDPTTAPRTLESFGAEGDGTTDDTTAVQAALDSQALVVADPTKTYLIQSALTVSNKVVRLQNATLKADFAGNLLAITQNGDQLVDIRRCRFITTETEPGIALSINRSGYSGTLERNVIHTIVEECTFSGDDYLAAGWTKAIYLDECHAAQIRRNNIIGRRDNGETGENQWWPGMTAGIEARSSADKNPVDSVYAENKIVYAQTAFLLRGIMEGDRFHRNTVLACRDGIDIDRTELVGSATSNPWVHVVNNHINVSRVAIQIKRAFFCFIQQNLIYEFTTVDLGFTGVLITSGNSQQIADNIVRFNSAATNAGIGVKLDQSNFSRIRANNFVNVKAIDKPVVVTDATGGSESNVIDGGTAYNASNAEVQLVYYEGTATEADNPRAKYLGKIGSGSNTGGTTSLTVDTPIALATISLNDAPKGSRFRIHATADIQKLGASSGLTKLWAIKSAGTATVAFGHDDSEWASQNPDQPSSTNWIGEINAYFEKTASGTLSVQIRAQSNDVAGQIADGRFQYIVERVA